MRVRFSKMHGAGNDFVVVDAVRQTIPVSRIDWQQLADRRLGIGADQILLVEPAENPHHDFRYRIFNADGKEVQQCGNGARCLVRFVHEQGLSAKSRLLVETRAGLIAPELVEGGEVVVDMGRPRFDLVAEGFLAKPCLAQISGSPPERICRLEVALESLPGVAQVLFDTAAIPPDSRVLGLDLLSMGNPHAVLWLDRPAGNALVDVLGPQLCSHAAFVEGVNLGFGFLDRSAATLHLRVFERGVGETLACGSGACAAAVLAIEHLWAASPLQVQARGGKLLIDWPGGDAHVRMQGPAQTVFSGEIELLLR